MSRQKGGWVCEDTREWEGGGGKGQVRVCFFFVWQKNLRPKDKKPKKRVPLRRWFYECEYRMEKGKRERQRLWVRNKTPP